MMAFAGRFLLLILGRPNLMKYSKELLTRLMKKVVKQFLRCLIGANLLALTSKNFALHLLSFVLAAFTRK